MTTHTHTAKTSTAAPADVLLHLARRARHAADAVELGFIVANETHALATYRQAALWWSEDGVRSLSGVVSPEANAPFTHWLDRVATRLNAARYAEPIVVTPELLAEADAAEWSEWLPAHALWLPIASTAPEAASGGILLARDDAWLSHEVALLAEWVDIWRHAWQGKQKSSTSKHFLRWLQGPRPEADKSTAHSEKLTWSWPLLKAKIRALPKVCWHSRSKRYSIIVFLCLCFPVRLSVLVPGELVPAQPAAIRAPLEGTIDRFFITPNQIVKAGQPLFQLDLTSLHSKLDVAQQGLATAEAEYRQAAQQAVFDARSKAQLASLQGRIAERRSDVEYLQAQLSRAQIVAPRDGLVLVDDPSEWIGKPVVTGERVMTITDEHEVEVEAWLSPADMIDLPEKSAITLYLNAAPLSPVSATLRYAAHEASLRPDASFAYRVRAVLDQGQAAQRVGLKGSARVAGHYVPVAYWLLRRPLSAIRPWLGV